MYKLTIIIPTYNCGEYTDKLLDCLNKQIKDEVQVIVVDDGSTIPYKTKYDWVELITKENEGASSARNIGLDNTKGKYVSFIDGDDLVSTNYITTIINKIDKEDFDYCYMSWKTIGNGWKSGKQLKSVNDEFDEWNLCVWNRIYKFSCIKDIRFNEQKQIAEDAEYIRLAEKVCKKKAFISEYMYYYRSDVEDSLTKRFAKGEIYTQRVVYFYPKITKDMTFLIDECRRINQYAEVIIMTYNNEISELTDYAMVMKPTYIKGTELRGEKTKLFTKITLPLKTQVVIYTNKTFAIGGIETFIYSFCMNMKDDYDITVLYDEMDIQQIKRLKPYVRVVKNNLARRIICDTLIINRITDEVPKNIKYEKKIQMVHCCKLINSWKVPTDNDLIIPVSDVVKKSFDSDIKNNNVKVINNFMHKQEPKRILHLVSATRLTFEKGEKRMYQFAKGLQDLNIPFTWTIFSDTPLRLPIPNVVIKKPTLDISSYIADSDYLVQLSDSEAFCYSIVESLELGTPVITTPLKVLDEIGVKNNENAFVVPFDMNNIDYKKIYEKHLKFSYRYNNSNVKKQWKEVLGNTTPKKDYVYSQELNEKISVIAIRKYYSNVLGRDVSIGEVFDVDEERCTQLLDAKVVKKK